jgi:hypothetical protein
LGDALTAVERVNAFMTDIGSATPDYEAVKTNFSSQMADYGDLQLSTYWDGTFFDEGNLEFALSDMVLDEESDGGFTGGVTYAGNVTGTDGTLGPFAITFVLVPEEAPLGRTNWLIRYILVAEVGDGSDIPITNYW